MVENPEFDRQIVVTTTTIDEIRQSITYTCPKCGKTETASMYSR